jgi:hypothetical protein
MMIELDADKQTTFTLEMEIEGEVGSSEKPEMRFCLELHDYTLSMKAVRIGNGVYEITCPKLKGLAENGTYNASVEVYIGDKRFVPLTETVKVKQELKPVVKMTEAKVDKPAAVSVKVASVTETKRPPSTITKSEIITR